MTLAAGFLAGASGRLLPASVPIRFFASAAVFHVLMWAALVAGVDQIVGFRGGLGPMLAATHVLTLGVLTTTAIGASAQLLPVATRHALSAVWPIKLVFWLVVPGIALLTGAMYAAHPVLLIAGAAVTTVGLILFVALLADNLRRARSLPVVTAYGWAALGALILLAALGSALALDYEWGVLPDHPAAALAHALLGGFGFMGLLVLGFSHVLIPMFALSATPDRRLSMWGFVLAVAAVVLGVSGALLGSLSILTIAALIGLGAAAVHLWIMFRALATGMRKRLGLSFVLIRAAWAMLPATLLVGLAALHGFAGANGETLFGVLLLGGWLLTFLLGILQRILPFLASMHASVSRRGAPPRISELAASAPIKIHAVCHGIALAALVAALVADVGWLARAGAVVGLVGALAFAYFTADVARHLTSQNGRDVETAHGR